MNDNEFGNEEIGLNLRHYHGTFLNVLRKATKIRQDSPVRDFNPPPPKKKSECTSEA